MNNIGPKTYVVQSTSKFSELFRIAVIVGGIGFFVFAGAIMTFGEWITGKGYDE